MLPMRDDTTQVGRFTPIQLIITDIKLITFGKLISIMSNHGWSPTASKKIGQIKNAELLIMEGDFGLAEVETNPWTTVRRILTDC